MYFLGGILSIIVFLFISSIDIKILREKETITISINNLKRYYNILNFIIIFIANIYFIYLFLNNSVLYMINFLCFLVLYICSITDVVFKNIFVNMIMVFLVPILLLNIYGNYMKMSIFGLLSGFLLYGSIYILSKIIYKKEVFGIGDIYILSLIGFVTDWYTVLNIGLFTYIVAGVFYLVKFLFVRNKKLFKEQEVPLVPFMLVSYLILIYF